MGLRGSRSWGLGGGRGLGVWVAKDLGFRGLRIWGFRIWGLGSLQGLGSSGFGVCGTADRWGQNSWIWGGQGLGGTKGLGVLGVF